MKKIEKPNDDLIHDLILKKIIPSIVIAVGLKIKLLLLLLLLLQVDVDERLRKKNQQVFNFKS